MVESWKGRVCKMILFVDEDVDLILILLLLDLFWTF